MEAAAGVGADAEPPPGPDAGPEPPPPPPPPTAAAKARPFSRQVTLREVGKAVAGAIAAPPPGKEEEGRVYLQGKDLEAFQTDLDLLLQRVDDSVAAQATVDG